MVRKKNKCQTLAGVWASPAEHDDNEHNNDEHNVALLNVPASAQSWQFPSSDDPLSEILDTLRKLTVSILGQRPTSLLLVEHGELVDDGLVEERRVDLFDIDGLVAHFVVFSVSYVPSVRASPAEHNGDEHDVAHLDVPPSAQIWRFPSSDDLRSEILDTLWKLTVSI